MLSTCSSLKMWSKLSFVWEKALLFCAGLLTNPHKEREAIYHSLFLGMRKSTWSRGTEASSCRFVEVRVAMHHREMCDCRCKLPWKISTKEVKFAPTKFPSAQCLGVLWDRQSLDTGWTSFQGNSSLTLLKSWWVLAPDLSCSISIYLQYGKLPTARQLHHAAAKAEGEEAAVKNDLHFVYHSTFGLLHQLGTALGVWGGLRRVWEKMRWRRHRGLQVLEQGGS